MSYLVLARKYRSKSFSEMVGQDHVVRALTNALQTQRLHHAYLFTGTRGVGKTTISRLLAKSLNCLGADGQGGITDEPCGVCQACRDIDAGRFVDYVELDAASNRGVDEISQLLEQSVYKPVVGRFKVFMIDEVHMLSNTAFNAMLKTLEEPPEYLKFVLATTDPQKVPVTVLSRCLQFNLRPIAPESIAEHLEQVLTAEQIVFDAGSLRLLAKAAHGSMRDALSLSDQAIAYSHGAIEEDAVRQMLGSVDRAHVYKLIEFLAAGDGKGVIEMVDFMRMQGLSAAAALDEMTTVLQRMAVIKVVPDALQVEDPDDASIGALVPLMASDEIQLLYSIALHGIGELGLASDEYAALVMVLLRVMAFRNPAQKGEKQVLPASSSLSLNPAKANVNVDATQAVPQQIKPQTKPQGKAQGGEVSTDANSVVSQTVCVSGASQAGLAEKKTELTDQRESENSGEPVAQADKVAVASVPVEVRAQARACVSSSSVALEPGGYLDDTDDLPPWVDDVIPDEGDMAPLPLERVHSDRSGNFSSVVKENLVDEKVSSTLNSAKSLTAVTATLGGEESVITLPPSSSESKRWEEVVKALTTQDLLKALVRELALNAQAVSISADEQFWVLKCARKTLMSEANQQKLVVLLEDYLGHKVKVSFEQGEVLDTPGLRARAALQQQQAQAEATVAADPYVQKLLHDFPGARVIPASIKPG